MVLEKKRHGNGLSIVVSGCLIMVICLVYIVNITHNGSQNQNQQMIEIQFTSKKKINVQMRDPIDVEKTEDRNDNSNEVNEIQNIFDQSRLLSDDLMKQFDQDIAKSNIKPLFKKQNHKEYIYHNTDKKIEAGICTNPYTILVLCLDDTDLKTRNSYRRTWAAKRERILTSDGYESLNWKIIFVVDIKSDSTTERLEFEKEQRHYHDILGFRLHNFRSVTFKLMSALEWVDDNCDYSFLVKMKSSMFLNTPKLFSIMHDPRIPSTDLYGGRETYETNKTTTFHSRDKSLVKGFPRFIEGTFVLSFDVVDKIIKKFNWSRPHPLTDVYIGELVLQSGVDVWPITNFVTIALDGRCAMRLIQEAAFIEAPQSCMDEFIKDSLKLIPEI